MEIHQNVALAPYTTFKIGGPADYFCVAQNEKDVIEALTFAEHHNLPVFVLGGGSNMLVSDAGFRGLVICFANKGFKVTKEDGSSVTLKIASGEIWDDVVKRTVDYGWWGIENLSHIPGLMGGFAVQNVGAYGQEASQVTQKIVAMEINSKTIKEFTPPDCAFAYRKSIFNTSQKSKYIILETIIKLSKEPHPNLTYGDVREYFDSRNIENPTQKQIRQAITEIRDKKFPYPTEAKNGNAGSFFRGRLLDVNSFGGFKEKIKKQFGIVALERLTKIEDRLRVPQGYKTPTAFVLDLCGLKGLSYGGAQVNVPQSAIVLNATGTATAADVLGLYQEVQKAVGEKLGLILEIEPELVGFSAEELRGIIN